MAYTHRTTSVNGTNTDRDPPNQVLWLRTILNKRALAPCAGRASIVINYAESNDVSSESHPFFSRSYDNHNCNLLKSASSLLILKCCLLANRFCKYFTKKRSNCPILSRVRIGNVDVILPVYMILDNDMASIALIPSGILLTGQVGYTSITFHRSIVSNKSTFYTELIQGTCHDSELTLCYHDVVMPWDITIRLCYLILIPVYHDHLS